MARKRIIEVEVEDRSIGSAIGWLLAGSAVGVVAGVLVAEKMSGRSLKGRSLWREARSLLALVAGRWEPLVDTAIDLRDAWAERREARDEEDEELDDEEEDDLDEEDGDEDDVDDEDLDDEDLDDEDEDDDDTDDDADHEGDAVDSPLGARVLEAFMNDPILAERAVEIDADDEGGVLLHGAVRSSREVAHAVTLAGGVPGVRSVRQRLRVRASRPR